MNKTEAANVLTRLFNNCNEINNQPQNNEKINHEIFPDYLVLFCFLNRLPDRTEVNVDDALKVMTR